MQFKVPCIKNNKGIKNYSKFVFSVIRQVKDIETIIS